ncbi:hypothetical protein [Pendulispora albinea]|uniref:Uncharacterized protein n=1 Tax=Pendulispora albinea TaxID=2741071 RepID=A0ABZ2LN95_9BACT
MNRSKRVARLAPSLLLLLPTFAGLACGGATPEPAAPPKPAETKPTSATTPPDVSAVPAPSTLIVFGRVAKPGDLLKVAGGWAGTTLPEDMVGRLVASAPIAAASELGRPVDFAVATDPRGRSASPGLALSMAVRPLEESRPVLEKYFTLKAAKGGVYSLEQKAQGEDEEDDRRFCAIYPSADASASAPAGAMVRLVCATAAWSLEALGPYLSRTTPREKFASDIHMDLTLGPFRETLNQGRSMFPTLLAGVLGIRKDDNPAVYELTAAAIGDLADFALDLDKLQFDAKAADPGAEGTLAASFKSNQALTTRLALSHPERAAAPPDAFWRMPASSDVAYFHRGTEEKELLHARDLALDALTKSLAKGGLAEADKNAIKGTISHLVSLLASPAVHAKGLDFEAQQKAFAALGAAGGGSGKPDAKADLARAEAVRTAVAQLGGWAITSFEEPAAKVQSVAKEIAALVARPAVAKWLKERHPHSPAPTLKETPSKLTASLPKGTTHYELTFVHADVKEDKAAEPKAGAKGAAAPAPKKVTVKLDKPVKLHVFFAPDGARTLVAYGMDDALVAKTLAGVVAGGTSLEQREGLAELKQAKLNAGGFFDARGFLSANPLTFASERHPQPEDPFRTLANSPAHGATPVPFTFLVQPGKDAAGTFVVTAKVPKAAVRELIAASINLGR